MVGPSLILFDTSALVAALVPLHPKHPWARAQLSQAGAPGLSTHSLAETFKVLTAHPLHRITATDAQTVLHAVTSQMTVIDLGLADYRAAMQRVGEQALSGSVIFDALIAQAALKAGAAALVTLNPKDFLRLGPDVAELVVQP